MQQNNSTTITEQFLSCSTVALLLGYRNIDYWNIKLSFRQIDLNHMRYDCIFLIYVWVKSIIGTVHVQNRDANMHV
jgi:hypothetical protein